MDTPSGFKPLTSSTTISITPSQPSNSKTMIMSAPNATGKPQQQPLPLQRALFEQAPFRRPSTIPGIPGPVPVSMSTQPSPSESFLSAPTPTSSIESIHNPQPMPTFYPHFSGVDNLILAAKIQASSNDTTPTCNATENSNFNMIYSNPSIAAPYSDYVTAYYQQQLLQQQQQQQQHHQMQRLHQAQQQQQQMRDAIVLTPMTSRDSQSMLAYDHQTKQPTPKNKHELELYELLKQANLLEYFGKFIKFGGDDVQQLAEADEQEFVEIMELVEMNHKPLHMRRMQKALNKWRQDGEESLEASENFKKPDALNDSGFYVNKVAQEYLSQHNTSLQSASSLNDSLAPTSTGVARSLFPNESNSTILEPPQQQYNTPLEVIKNAPKKPRLMDNIKPSDLTKGIQIDDNGPLGSTPKKVKPQNKHFSGSASSPASGYSPDYCPYSPTYSDISVDDGPVMEVSEPVKDPVKKLTGTSKRKRSMKKPSIATDLSRY